MPEHYRGLAFVHWTLTVDDRGKGWLTPSFHDYWRLILLHACARYSLVCPTYVLMADHAHLLLSGVSETESDQRTAISFLRKYTKVRLAPFMWQQQPHDHVLRTQERQAGAFTDIAAYILDNPIRAGLTGTRALYPHLGCCVPGYPDLNPCQTDYWELFWRIYNKLVDAS